MVVFEGTTVVNVEVIHDVEVVLPGTRVGTVTVVVLVTGVGAGFVHFNGVVHGTTETVVHNEVQMVE